MHGTGVHTFVDGSHYEGQFKHHEKHGHGVMPVKLLQSTFAAL